MLLSRCTNRPDTASPAKPELTMKSHQTREELQFTFFKYPPRCKTHCCTKGLLEIWRPFMSRTGLWFKPYNRDPEWIFDCTDYPEPPKRTESRYWDLEVQGDIRFSKSFENLLSRNYGWRWASAKHIPYMVDSGPRRMTLIICASIFIYLILQLFIWTMV